MTFFIFAAQRRCFLATLSETGGAVFIATLIKSKLIPGMEIFQGTETQKSHMGVYYGKYDFGEGLKHAVYQSTIPRTSLKAKYEDSNKEGPNLTAMNNRWKYWIWPKHIVL